MSHFWRGLLKGKSSQRIVRVSVGSLLLIFLGCVSSQKLNSVDRQPSSFEQVPILVTSLRCNRFPKRTFDLTMQSEKGLALRKRVSYNKENKLSIAKGTFTPPIKPRHSSYPGYGSNPRFGSFPSYSPFVSLASMPHKDETKFTMIFRNNRLSTLTTNEKGFGKKIKDVRGKPGGKRGKKRRLSFYQGIQAAIYEAQSCCLKKGENRIKCINALVKFGKKHIKIRDLEKQLNEAHQSNE